jgi:hypothetical protein
MARSSREQAAMANEPPAIHKISGRLRNLRMTTQRRGWRATRTTFRMYRFELELPREDSETPGLLAHRAAKADERFVMSFTTAAAFGDVIPFLAEGDRVEMAVQLFEDSPTWREPLVYALRNLEDDCAYVSQAIFLRGFEFGYKARYSLPGMSRRRRNRTFLWLACCYFIAFLVVAVPIWLSGDKESVAYLAAAMLGMLAIGLAIFAWQGLRRRLGWLSPRQRLLANVYSLMALGSVEVPAPRVYSV